ncbi:hypothetical protein X975_04986, partial [Stegodyphus mimosarum]
MNNRLIFLFMVVMVLAVFIAVSQADLCKVVCETECDESGEFCKKTCTLQCADPVSKIVYEAPYEE